MKKGILFGILTALLVLLVLPFCGTPAAEKPRLTVVCATYPIYLFASSLAENVDGVAVERLDTGTASCLHDYTLSMADMKKLERADIIALNGAGLEEFLEDALAASDAQVIDCSAGVELLENLSHRHDGDGHDSHDHGHWDPHYWMDPANARIMADNLRGGMALTDPEHAGEYEANAVKTEEILLQVEKDARELMERYLPQGVPGLITFHDGFQYFARAFHLPLLASIEEEAGSEASAREIVEITRLVKEYDIPVIFTEVNGSDATARAISRETGCRVAQLTMIMDGPDASDPEFGGVAHYGQLRWDVRSIINGFCGEGTVPNG
ncbi:MAG: zinc ABC transporter substrate-binding protein [Lawsonibacter sp.]|jgi:zinc transport system substrate-binding protein|nr:zinc ABC transporter substrate-binding protein [Lawsonibacter sp.]